MDAVAQTPRHYCSVRLHRFVLRDGALHGDLALTRTSYYDFDDRPPWRAVRLLRPEPGEPAA